MKLIVRNTHKYLSFFISIQLLLWTISGIYFAFNKIENVRGEQYRAQTSSNYNFQKIEFEIPDAVSVNVKNRLGKTIIAASTKNGMRYFDEEGRVLQKISFDEAKQLVSKHTFLKPIAVEEIYTSEEGSEYRGRELPLYKVVTRNANDNEINAYLNIFTGEVVAIRSAQWRIWDLMWGFHIMDWQERDNIDNLLLKIFSILALVSSISGILLFFKIDIKKEA
ncbi:hypothetical protein OAQ75_02725 [Gammaproteobacteria bacterium]|nr:hypothetical protein [Gammaproteobacteria bacterium]MDC1021501.1 hypothetical protein [Gammaproteobacteria bacterium]